MVNGFPEGSFFVCFVLFCFAFFDRIVEPVSKYPKMTKIWKILQNKPKSFPKFPKKLVKISRDVCDFISNSRIASEKNYSFCFQWFIAILLL